MKKILMIGPFSKQINGMTVANKMLYSGLESQYQVELIDTLKDEKFENKENQGKFRLFKLIKIIKCLYRELYTIARNPYDYIYMTPGQSFYGFSRFIPYMLFAILKKENSIYIFMVVNLEKCMMNSQNSKDILLNFS